MPLDLTYISVQIAEMSETFTGDDYLGDLALACELLHAIVPEQLRAKYRSRRADHVKIPWPEAYVPHSLDGAFKAPEPPTQFGVAAADGSDIPPDRHSPIHFGVINTGRVYLQYGTQPAAKVEDHFRLPVDAL